MSYLAVKRPLIRIATIQLNTAGVSVSNVAPTVALPTMIWQTSSSGSATLSSNEITLTAGKKYLLQATLSWNAKVDWSDDRFFKFYNETAGAWIGKAGMCFSGYEAYSSGVAYNRIDEMSRAIILPGVSTDISLKYSGSTVQTFTVGDRPLTSPWINLTAYGRIEVWEFEQ